MAGKTKLRVISIIFMGIFLCAMFGGVVEGAEVKERNDVTVTSTETEIIESTYTDKWRNRIFQIRNGENEIITTLWGSNDDENWEYWDSVTIGPNENENIVLGTNHFWYVKLTGITTQPTEVSVVDATLNYHIP
jgi:hypothetical protein